MQGGVAEETNLLLFPGKRLQNQALECWEPLLVILLRWIQPAQEPFPVQHCHIPIFPLFPDSGTSVQSPALPAAPGACPGDIPCLFGELPPSCCASLFNN